MKSSQRDIELLEKYIKSTLSAEEIRTLEARLISDADLKADLDDLKILRAGMRANSLEGKMKMIKGWEEEIEKDKKQGQKWWKWGIFIFLIAILGYLLYFNAIKSEQGVPEEYKTLYAAEFDKNLVLHSTKRSVTQVDKLSAEQRRAFDLYRIQLFDDAIPLLDALWTNQKDTLALFYLGVSQIGIGEKEKGLMIFKKPELNNYSKQTNLFFNH